jgi:hypothetical protein
MIFLIGIAIGPVTGSGPEDRNAPDFWNTSGKNGTTLLVAPAETPTINSSGTFSALPDSSGNPDVLKSGQSPKGIYNETMTSPGNFVVIYWPEPSNRTPPTDPSSGIVNPSTSGNPNTVFPANPGSGNDADLPIYNNQGIWGGSYISPEKAIKPGTRPSFASRKEGSLEMVYYHPDGTLWLSSTLQSDYPKWQPEQVVYSVPGFFLYSPALCSLGKHDLHVFVVNVGNDLFMKNWTQSGGWQATWSNPGPPYGDVYSSPAVVKRGSGPLIDFMYRNQTGYLIHRNYSEQVWGMPGVWGPIEAIGAAPNDDFSLISTSETSLDVYGTFPFVNNHIWNRHWDESSGWADWRDTGIVGYSSVSGITRPVISSTNSNYVDLVYNQSATAGNFGWISSEDGGSSWNIPASIDVLSSGTSYAVGAYNFNHLEFLQENAAKIYRKYWNGPTLGKIGVFRGGFWILDYNGNGIWDGTTIDKLASFGQSGDVPVMGRWQSSLDMQDAKIGIFRNGFWILDQNGNFQWDGTGAGADIVAGFGQAGDVPVVGRWNNVQFFQADYQEKIGVFRNGVWLIDYNGNFLWDSPDKTANIGQSGDIPVVGSWNGDWNTSIGVFRDGFWILDYNENYQWDGTGPGADMVCSIGQHGDIPVPGIWSGDQSTYVGVFRNGVWILDFNGNGHWDGTEGGDPDKVATFGQAGDIPVVRDWNGDLYSEIGVFRPTTGEWLIDFNRNFIWDGSEEDIDVYLGNPGDNNAAGYFHNWGIYSK